MQTLHQPHPTFSKDIQALPSAHHVVEQFPEALLIENARREILFVNQVFCDIWQINVAPETLMDSPSQQLQTYYDTFIKDSASFLQEINQLYKKPTIALHNEIQLTNQTYLSWHHTPILVGEECVGHIWHFYNISPQKKKIRQQQSLIQKLKSANKIKDRLISVISHDLRGPLATLKGFLKLYAQDKVSEQDMKAIAKDTALSLDGVLQLFNNLLQWTATQISQKHITFHPLNLHYLVEGRLEQLRVQAQQKNITLINNTNTNLTVRANMDMIKFILRNLIGNAIKFTENGTIIINAEPQSPQHIAITVKDTGRGMTLAQQEQLFNWATRRSTSGTAQEKGTGLGLLICKEFAEKHGSDIKVCSAPNEGSAFTFVLPRI